eukprot:gene24540-39868_t
MWSRVQFVDLLPGVPVMIPLDLSVLRERHVNASAGRGRGGAAAYYANFHKWMYTPKGSAFMWASPEFQPLLIPAVLSGCEGDFQCSFEYTGTRDYTAMLTMPRGIAFRASLGSEEYDTFVRLGERVLRLWGDAGAD